MKKLILLLIVCFLVRPCLANNFFQEMGSNLKKAFTPSEFICDKYEKQEYKILVLRPGMKLPFTEVHPKKKICTRWGEDSSSALGKHCVKYEYINSSHAEESRMYKKVKRYRTVCVEGHSTR